jgi:hypothetical protein
MYNHYNGLNCQLCVCKTIEFIPRSFNTNIFSSKHNKICGISSRKCHILQPWMASPFKKRGMYVCMKRYHTSRNSLHLLYRYFAACRASRRWVRNSPKDSRRFLAASLSPIRQTLNFCSENVRFYSCFKDAYCLLHNV